MAKSGDAYGMHPFLGVYSSFFRPGYAYSHAYGDTIYIILFFLFFVFYMSILILI